MTYPRAYSRGGQVSRPLSLIQSPSYCPSVFHPHHSDHSYCLSQKWLHLDSERPFIPNSRVPSGQSTLTPRWGYKVKGERLSLWFAPGSGSHPTLRLPRCGSLHWITHPTPNCYDLNMDITVKISERVLEEPKPKTLKDSKHSTFHPHHLVNP